MINVKAIIGVVMVAVLIGVLYVIFEKNFFGGSALSNSKPSTSQELSKDTPVTQVQQQSSLINLPAPEASPAPIDKSSDLLQEAKGLQMRDYSTYFEELKDAVSK